MPETVPENKSTLRQRVGGALLYVVAPVSIYASHPGTMEAYVRRALGAETAQERLIGKAATEIAGKKILVNCTNKIGMLFAGNPETQASAPVLASSRAILLRPWLCDSLEAFAAGRTTMQNVTSAQTDALHILAHEISHIKGNGNGVELNESITECYAFQRLPEVASAFGASAQLANNLAHADATLDLGLEEYRAPSDCIDGGPYDLDPARQGTFPQFAPQTK